MHASEKQYMFLWSKILLSILTILLMTKYIFSFILDQILLLICTFTFVSEWWMYNGKLINNAEEKKSYSKAFISCFEYKSMYPPIFNTCSYLYTIFIPFYVINKKKLYILHVGMKVIRSKSSNKSFNYIQETLPS